MADDAPPVATNADLIKRLSVDLAEAESRGKLAVSTARWAAAASFFQRAADLEALIAELKA